MSFRKKIIKREVFNGINFLDKPMFLPSRNVRSIAVANKEFKKKYECGDRYVLAYSENLGHPTLFDIKVLYTLLYTYQHNTKEKKIYLKPYSRFLQKMSYSLKTSSKTFYINRLKESLRRWNHTSCFFKEYRVSKNEVMNLTVNAIIAYEYTNEKNHILELDPIFAEASCNSYSRKFDLDRILGFKSGLTFRCYEVICKMEHTLKNKGEWPIYLKDFYDRTGLTHTFKISGNATNSRSLLKKALNEVVEELKDEGVFKLSWKFEESRKGTLIKFINKDYEDSVIFLEDHEKGLGIKNIIDAYLGDVQDKVLVDANSMRWTYKKGNCIFIEVGKIKIGMVKNADFIDFKMLLKRSMFLAEEEVYKEHKVCIDINFIENLNLQVVI